jgi:hypothetical protein
MKLAIRTDFFRTLQHRFLVGLVLLCGVGWTLAENSAPNPMAAAQELRFRDFFHTPFGPKGPEISAALKAADGHPVRLTGYMVHQDHAQPGRFLFTPRPVRMSEHADGDADDLPLAWVMVYLDPSQSDFVVPHVAGVLELSGSLSVGRLEEQDGRVSWVRLHLTPEATRPMNSQEFASYLQSLQHHD